MPYPIPAEVLKHVREAQGLSQTVLAKRMETVASVLSKLERADEVDSEMADRYLSAIESAQAEAVRAFYARDWLQAQPPSFLHPDAEELWIIDQALKDLESFEAENDDPILRGPIGLLRGELKTSEAYLRRRDHVVAWVGDIGVGKTTALIHAAGLLVGDGRSGRKPVFPVGPGRTTVCETAIRVSPTFGVLVDARDDAEVVRLTRDLVTSLSSGGGAAAPAEIGRVLRGMSGMLEDNAVVDEEPVTIDPIVDLLASGLSVEEITDRMIAAMRLADRKEGQIILPEGRDDGLAWVSSLVSDINFGLDRRFSLPKRITVLMPSKNLAADGQTLQVIDTKGIEGVTQRRDLAEHADHDRTLLVLCSKFADAPSTTVQRLLQESVDAGSNAAALKRQAILVLPRNTEALEIPSFGGGAMTRALGYAIRRKEAEQALANAGLPKTPVYFFDALNDDPDKIWKILRDQITSMRGVYAEAGRRAAAGVANLRENVNDVRAAEARLEVERELGRVLGLVATLPAAMRPAHLNLIDQLAIGHHSSIAASIVRHGDWDHFNFAHILGQGVRIDANQRTLALAMKVQHKLEDLEEKYGELPGVVQSLQALRARLDARRQEFLATARVIGSDAYGGLLDGESDIWRDTARRYGLGSGYKRDVAGQWRDWFETAEAAGAVAESVSERLQDAWTVGVIDSMRSALRAGEEG